MNITISSDLVTMGRYGIGAAAVTTGNALKAAAVAVPVFFLFVITTDITKQLDGIHTICPLATKQNECSNTLKAHGIGQDLFSPTFSSIVLAPTVYQLGEYLRSNGMKLLA